MLSTLRIRHIGVIDDATLDFGPGFTALTGETGAGKTMIVTGLSMLLGERLDRGRAGTASSVDGVIAVPGHARLIEGIDELGAEIEDDEVLIARRVTKDGRSRAHIGGVPVPIGTLSTLVGSAVTVHGQMDQQRLRGPEPQREALDTFAIASIGEPLARHRELWEQRRALVAERDELAGLLAERSRRGDLLREALEQIEQVDPQPHEDDDLRAELERLGHAVELREAAVQSSLALVGDDGPSVASLLDLATTAVGTAARTDRALAPLAERLDAVRLDVSDIAAELSRYAEDVEASPGRLDAANERLHELTLLLRDTGAALPGAQDVTELLEISQGAAADLDRFDGAQERHAVVEEQLAALDAQLDEAASALTAARTAAAEHLARAVEAELRELEMPQASIRVEVTEHAPREHGRDAVAILISPHPGARHLPVATSASGGELSRVMLALEVALASSREDRSGAPVFVFDEIDAGIGGRAALAVGQRLAQLAQHAQVIVVTHLPQVAAHATTHLRIVKTAEGDRTSSTVESLDHEARVRELARMLAGDDASRTAREHAAELLAQSQGAGAPAAEAP
ncbi:DNA repair protein RecN [Brachybacterium phenoliresistens]|uniref:DNA repair protein RecN n=1 Tax=Brachybacterium phenoliresistens TaxID=396014 RepID=Z9JX56_9MICO|nr:DNA repair protein RecN [Brachybacterium phenoliresistens]EWS82955.1 DNA recombination protein RecN [Brachybacterium phenoliresistens]